MGADKASLVLHGRPLLVHVVDALAVALDGPIVLAAAPGQALPDLPDLPGPHGASSCRPLRVDDPRPGAGPLVGFTSGLRALLACEPGLGSVVLVAVDLPGLRSEHVRRVVDLLAAAPSAWAAVPDLDGRLQPLAAAWRPDVLPIAERLVADGEGGLRPLLAAVEVRRVSAAELLADPRLAAVDPDLAGFRDVDAPEDLPRDPTDGTPGSERADAARPPRVPGATPEAC